MLVQKERMTDMMKRFLVLAMALCMALAMGIAFADDAETTPVYDQAKHDTVCVAELGWGEKWSDDYKAQAELCNNEEHTFAPTCEEMGANCYLCPLCLACVHKEEVDPTGHDYVDVKKEDATCLKDGHEAYAYCANTLDKKGNPTEFFVANEKNEKTGYDKIEKPTVLPKLNHMKDGEVVMVPDGDWDPDTFLCGQEYSLDAKCGICGEKLVDKITIKIDHEFKPVKEVAPTCVETGVKAHEKCVRNDCTAIRFEGEIYANDQDEDLVEAWTIKALDHNLVAVNGTPGSCEEDAYGDHMACDRKGCDYTEGYLPLPAPGHKYTIDVPAVAATCDKTGLKAAKKCEVCGQMAELVNKVYVKIEKQTVTPALNHMKDGKSAWQTILGTPATCTTTGVAAHRVCTLCKAVQYNGSEYAQKIGQELVVIPAHGHVDEDGYERNTVGLIERKADKTQLLVQRDMIQLGKLDLIGLEREPIDKDPTCTKTGYKATKWCPWCFEIRVQPEVIPAKGHDWELTEKGTMPTCEETGLSDLWTCKVCGETEGNEEIAARGHDLKYVEAVFADCENDGNLAYSYCDRADCCYGVEDSIYYIVESGAGFGKTEGTSVLLKNKKGELVGHPADVVIVAFEHGYAKDKAGEYIYDPAEFILPIKAVAATCYATGIEGDGEYCVLCNEITKDPTVIPMKEHNFMVNLAAHDATCTENGFKGAKLCLGGCCVAYTELENGKKEFFKFTVDEKGVVGGLDHLNIPALGHDEKAGESKEATCYEDGFEAGTYCARCGLTLKAQVTIPAAHKWQDKAAEAPTCTKAGKTAGKYCPVCKTNTQEVVPATGHKYDNFVEAVEPTCTEKGHEEGLSCSVCDPEYADGKNDAWLIYPSEVPALGHCYHYIPGVYYCGAEVNHYGFYYCDVCDHGSVRNEQDLDFEIVFPAVDDFTVTYKTGKDGKIIDKTPANVIIPDAVKVEAPAHTWNDYYDRAPTCTEDGVTTARQCKVCGLKESEKFRPATGHSYEVVPGTAATCEKDGVKDGKKCSVCGDEIKGAVIPATGHKMVHVDRKDPTCEEAGHEDGKICDNGCGKKEGAAEIKALGHDVKGVEWKVVTDQDGISIRIKRCVRCNEVAVWEPIEEAAEGKLGDANGDGVISLADALAVLAYYGDNTNTINEKNADVNLDGVISLADALAIVRMWVGA